MSRRKSAVKRNYFPDPKFNEKIVTKFINQLMVQGKKSVAEKIFYGALDIVGEKNKDDSQIDSFKKAMDKIKPALEVKSRRVGGATYQVPIDVRPERSVALAMRWLIAAAKKRNEYYMKNKLANEILDALKETGAAYKKKEDTHKMADANRAFAHFKW
ncbi:MAG: 30S ribosomal protein S7 [Nitrospinae bacterium]|nr:30S ribosomal protein S7 [Nitrospinota bacterium]